MTAGDGDKPQKLRFFLMEIHGDPAKILRLPMWPSVMNWLPVFLVVFSVAEII